METIYEGINLKKKKYIYIYICTEKVMLIFSFFFPDFFSFQSREVVVRQPYLKLNNYSFFSFICRNRNGIENEQMIRWLEYERFTDEISFLQVTKSHRIYLMQDLTILLTCFNSED